MEILTFHFFIPLITSLLMSCRRFQLETRIFRMCPKKPLWSSAQKYTRQLNLIYLNNDEHMHMDRAKGSTDILDMAFISPNLAKHYIQFQISDDLGSDHLPIEISIDTPPHRNTFTNHNKYKFDETD